jgi:hypothetical protein
MNTDVDILKIINEALDRYDTLTPLEQKDLILKIQKFGAVMEHAPELPESVCPITHISLQLPCGLTKCSYWVDHPWTKNCALNFMSVHEKEQLTMEQVSLLYRKSPERVDSIYKRCFKILQRHYLRDLLRNKAVPRFHFYKGFCVACQSRLLQEEMDDPTLRLEEGFGYCSADCKKQYTPHYFEIEKFFEADFYRVVEVGSELFNFYALEEILGFQPNVLRNRLEKIREGTDKNR